MKLRTYQRAIISSLNINNQAIVLLPRRSGKAIIAMSAIKERTDKAKGNYIYFPLSVKNANYTIDPAIKSVFGEQPKSDCNGKYTLKNGSTILITNNTNEDCYKGMDITGVVFDDSPLKSEEVLKLLKFFRPMLMINKDPFVLIIGTPREQCDSDSKEGLCKLYYELYESYSRFCYDCSETQHLTEDILLQFDEYFGDKLSNESFFPCMFLHKKSNEIKS